MPSNSENRISDSEIRSTLRYLQEQINALTGGLFGISFQQNDFIIYDGNALDRFAAGTDGYVLTTHGTSSPPTWEPSIFSVSAYALTLLGATDAENALSILEADEFAIEFGFDAGTGNLVPGQVMDYEIIFDCQLFANAILPKNSGSIVFDVAVGPRTSGAPSASICASAKPTLTAAVTSADTNLTGWTKNISAGSWVRVSIVTVSGLAQATLSLRARRTP